MHPAHSVKCVMVSSAARHTKHVSASTPFTAFVMRAFGSRIMDQMVVENASDIWKKPLQRLPCTSYRKEGYRNDDCDKNQKNHSFLFQKTGSGRIKISPRELGAVRVQHRISIIFFHSDEICHDEEGNVRHLTGYSEF